MNNASDLLHAVGCYLTGKRPRWMRVPQIVSELDHSVEALRRVRKEMESLLDFHGGDKSDTRWIVKPDGSYARGNRITDRHDVIEAFGEGPMKG